MTAAKALVQLLFDPRGRMSRSGLLVSASLLLLVELVIALHGVAPGGSTPLHLMVIKGIALWVGMAGIIKRLHDADASAWWVLAGLGFLCIWCFIIAFLAVFVFGVEAFDPVSPSHAILLGLFMLPAIGAALWLHLVPGTPMMNRFGPVPAGFGGKATAQGQPQTLA